MCRAVGMELAIGACRLCWLWPISGPYHVTGVGAIAVALPHAAMGSHGKGTGGGVGTALAHGAASII
jgi:hypothetical protein